MPAIIPHPVHSGDIEFTRDDSWHTVDLSPYLLNQDATGVVLQLANTNTGSTSYWCGARPFGYSGNLGGDVHYLRGGQMFAVGFVYGTTKWVQLRAESADVDVRIVAEFRDGVKFHAAMIDISPLIAFALSTWIDRRVTLLGDDTYSDVEAVIVCVQTTGTASDPFPVWNARRKGSVITLTPSAAQATCPLHWMPVGVDEDGYYQVYSSGKEDPFSSDNIIWEVGYIKKGEFIAITDPADEGIMHCLYGCWETWNFGPDGSGTVPAGANVLVGRWAYHGSGLSHHYAVQFRPFESDSNFIRQNDKTQMTSQVAKLDSQQRCEYQLSLQSNDFYVLGYETYESPDANKLILDTGTIDNPGKINIHIPSVFRVTNGRSASIRSGTVHANILQDLDAPCGTADTFSVFTWIYCTDITSDGSILQYSPKSTGSNGAWLHARGTQAGDPFQVYIRGLGSINTKEYLFGQMPLNTWTHIGFTYDGTGDGTLKVYQDGEEVTPTKTLDEICTTLTELDRWVSLGYFTNVGGNASLDADLHSMGIWSKVLSDDEIVDIYNSGNGDGFDLSANKGDYVSASSLQHWWRMGYVFTDPEWFDDYGLSPIDLDTWLGPFADWTEDDFAENAPT